MVPVQMRKTLKLPSTVRVEPESAPLPHHLVSMVHWSEKTQAELTLMPKSQKSLDLTDSPLSSHSNRRLDQSVPISNRGSF
jgi:hypothetical protein